MIRTAAIEGEAAVLILMVCPEGARSVLRLLSSRIKL